MVGGSIKDTGPCTQCAGGKQTCDSDQPCTSRSNLGICSNKTSTNAIPAPGSVGTSSHSESPSFPVTSDTNKLINTPSWTAPTTSTTTMAAAAGTVEPVALPVDTSTSGLSHSAAELTDAELIQVVADLEEKIQFLLKSVTAIECQTEATKRDVEALWRELKAAQRDLEATRRELEAARREIADLKSNVKRARREMSKLSTTVKTHAAVVCRAGRQLKRAQAETNGGSSKPKATNRKVKQLVNWCNKVRSKLRGWGRRQAPKQGDGKKV